MVKPIIKPLYDANGDKIDEIAKCGICGEFICYPTEFNAKGHYRYCTYCGTEIDWEGGGADET